MDDFGLDLVDDDLGAMDYASLGGYIDFGDDDDDDDDFGIDYYDFGDDDDDDDDDDLGRRRRRRAKRGRRRRRRGGGSRRRAKRPSKRPAAKKAQVVQKTMLVGTTGPQILGAWNITIRPQFDFVAEDLTFSGSIMGSNAGGVPGVWSITGIQFGDRIVFSNPVGVPVAIFVVGGFMRGLVKGAAIAAGLDIMINAVLTNANATTPGTLTATFSGLKRGTTGCGPGAV